MSGCFQAVLHWVIGTIGTSIVLALLGLEAPDSGFPAVIGGVVFMLYMGKRKKDQDSRRAEAREAEAIEVENAVMRHFPALRRNLDRAIRHDDYGGIKADDRRSVIDDFLNSVGVAAPILREDGEHYSVVLATVGLEAERDRRSGFDPTILPATGLEFEHWVAQNLQKYGWDARATVGAGDQGVDVLATKDGLTVAIQCKLYAGTIGNKAVQEIIAGKGFYGADYAAVMSSTPYTKSAVALAASHGVALLSPHDIPRMDDLIRD